MMDCSVPTIADILAQNPTPPDRKRRKADKEEIVEPITKTRKQISFTYEDSVFNYLFENKQDLGIEQVYRLKNQRMDGELVLTDGSLVVIEIKMCMNWLKPVPTPPSTLPSGTRHLSKLSGRVSDALRILS